MKKFTFILAAALFCGSFTAFAQDDEVKIERSMDDHLNPQFSFQDDYMYYAIYLGEDTREKMGVKDDQFVYIGADDAAGRPLQVWSNTFTFNDPLGINSFGVAGDFMSVEVGDGGWSGLGYHVDANNPIDLSKIGDDYHFRFAVRSFNEADIEFYLTDLEGHEAKLALGDEGFNDDEAIGNFERDGEWYTVDVPMSYLADQFEFSLKGASEYKDKNLLCLLGGGEEGTQIDYDAVFFYGPKNSTSGVKEIESIESKNAPLYIYTADGKAVSEAYAKANKGMYIVKQGNKTKKVVID